MIELIQGLLAALLTGLVGWAFARSQRASRMEAGQGVMAPPRALLVLGLVTFLFFAALTVASYAAIAEGNPTASLPVSATFAVMSLGGVYLIVEFVRTRYALSDRGMELRTLTKRGFLRWSAVRRVSYSPSMKWFVVESHDGAKLRVSAMLTGLPTFADHVLDSAPGATIDDACRKILVDAKRGILPAIM